MKIRSTHKCFGGTVAFISHWSPSTQCDMNFSIFVPGGRGPFPALTFLSGLTCTDENFMVKSGAQRLAAEKRFILINPDTSPRECGIKREDDDWDFGTGAGFYVNSTRIPWKRHYNMYDYVVKDLQAMLHKNFPAKNGCQGIFGHSMGGHGALTIGLKHPEIYKSISAFSPISAPMDSPWGQKAFTSYLGEDRRAWREYDASRVIAGIENAKKCPEILVDQGMADEWLEKELKVETLEAGAKKSGYPLNLRYHEGYDHGYYFIQSFMFDHFEHHEKILMEK
ncbi:MAG: S-formylglutathione hydrolase [Sphingomonadales bacterium]